MTHLGIQVCAHARKVRVSNRVPAQHVLPLAQK